MNLKEELQLDYDRLKDEVGRRRDKSQKEVGGNDKLYLQIKDL